MTEPSQPSTTECQGYAQRLYWLRNCAADTAKEMWRGAFLAWKGWATAAEDDPPPEGTEDYPQPPPPPPPQPAEPDPFDAELQWLSDSDTTHLSPTEWSTVLSAYRSATWGT